MQEHLKTSVFRCFHNLRRKPH